MGHPGSLLQLRGMSEEALRGLLGRAREIATGTGQAAKQEEKLVACVFLEDSTRTRVSFAVAAGRLGARVVEVQSSNSSVRKGESLADTVRTVESLGADAIVLRASGSGSSHAAARAVGVPVINAGDGRHEHPTQGLIDCLTLCEAKGREDFDLRGVRIAIVGDVVSSRVARSAIAGMTALGAGVVCVGPATMAPDGLAALGCEVSRDFDAVVGDVDAVMMLRVQFERHGNGDGHGAHGKAGEGGQDARADRPPAAPIGSVREFRAGYGLTAERAARMREGAVVMHPGPMNRGLEIDGEVADGARSLVRRQVALGVAVRMAVIGRALQSKAGAGT